jgi:hypothetical protein
MLKNISNEQFDKNRLNFVVQLDNRILDQIISIKKLIEGRVLTIIDASISDVEQRNGLKSLIRESIWQNEYYSKNITDIIIQFDSITGLNLINNSEVERMLKKIPYSDGELPVESYFN